jgi:hypothetical protein
MGFAGTSLLVLTGALSWSSNIALQTQRNDHYFNSAAAAELTAEKVRAQIKPSTSSSTSCISQPP